MATGEWYKDYNAIQRKSPAGSGGASWAAYLRQKTAVEKGYAEAYKELDYAAQEEGVSAERPMISGSMSQAQHQELLQKYLSNINNEVLKKNVTLALKDVQSQGVAAGVSVGLPSLANLTHENAQSFIDTYINTVNQRIYVNYATTAVNDLHSQGIAGGVNVAVPVVSGSLTQASVQNIIDNYQSQVNNALIVKSTQDAINSVASQAKQYGVSVSTPNVSGNITEDSANKMIDSYVSQVNSAILVKNTQDSLKSIQVQAASYGVTLAAPSVSSSITETAANALIDKYVADVNTKLSTMAATEAQAQAVSSSQIQTSQVLNNALVGSLTTFSPTQTVTEGGITKTYTIENGKLYNVGVKGNLYALSEYELSHDVKNVEYDSKGNITYYEIGTPTGWTTSTYEKAQQSQQTAAIAQVKAGTYVAPEVKGSGLAYKVALSNADQKELIRERESNPKLTELQFRLDRGLSVVTVAGSYVEPKFKGGNKSANANTVKKSELNTAKISTKLTGSEKLAKINASSSINSSVVARSGTAKDVKAVKLSVKDVNIKESAKHPGQIQLKDGTWVNQIEKVGNGSVKEAITVIGAVKSLEEADKLYQQKLAGSYNPVSRKDITSGDTKTVIHGTVTNEYAKAKHDKIVADIKAAKQLAVEIEKTFKPILDAREKVVNPITVQGKFGTGAANVTYKSGKYEKTAGTYRSELKAAQQNAKIPITNKTSEKDKKIILAAQAYLESHNMNADLVSASFVGSKAVPFKTVDQLNYEKTLKSDIPTFAAMAKLNKKFQDTFSYKNVTGKASKELGEINKEVAEFLDLPSLAEIEKKRDALIPDIQFKVTQPGKATREYTLKDKHREAQEVVYSNKYGKAVMDTTYDALESGRTKPVTAAATVAAMYASGAIAGVVVEGGLGLTALGASKIAAKAGAGTLISKGAGVAAKYIPTAGRLTLGTYVGVEGAKTVMSGDAQKTVNFITSLAVGGMGYSKGAKIVKDPISIIPGVKTVKLQEVTAGHGTTVKDITVGETFSIGGKSVISRNANGGFVRGAPSLPVEMSKTLSIEGKLENRLIQAFDKADNAAFEATARRWSGESDVLLFKSGKKISDVAYGLNKPVTTPKKFEITSEHVPNDIKPIVKDTIVAFGKGKSQGIEVYGSVAQKAQMKGYLSRIPQDIEVSVSSTDKFIALFKTKAVKAGFKESVDFRITKVEADAPKIEFKIDGKWQKGVEVFSSKAGKNKDMPGYRSEDRIAFGYEKLGSLKVEDIKMMKLQEQAARKHAGATSLQGGEIKPVHPGRSKDIRDLIEIGVANEVTFKTGISKEIIQYARLYPANEFNVIY